jgi:hypothetical protein
MMWAALTLLLGTLWIGRIAAQASAHDSSGAQSTMKTIDNPGGGHIYLGGLTGQLTPPEALGKTLHHMSVLYGERPKLGRLVQNPSGEILAGFFTVTAKNKDGKSMSGLAMAYAPKSGPAAGAVLMDNSDRFPSTVNSMFASLKQELGKAPASSGTASKTAAPMKEAPPESLQPVVFPDGTGVIGLPAGWHMLQAQMGDVGANGPHGETLRFGWTIPVIDPTNPQSRALMGNSRGPAPRNFVAIPFGTDPAIAFKAVMAQMSQKLRKQPPDVDIAKVQDMPLEGERTTSSTVTWIFTTARGSNFSCRK